MKYLYALFILITPIQLFGQNLGMYETPIDERGRYNISYIHNFYSRSESAVKTVALEYMNQLKLKDIIVDTVNHIVKSETKIHFKGRKKDCAKDIWLTIPIHIYYVFGRTKIEFTDIEYETNVSLCEQKGTLIELTSCEKCDNYALLLKTVRAEAYAISAGYKNYLKKRSLDNDLF